MGNYIENELEPGEIVYLRAHYHWWFNLRSLGLLNAFNHLMVTDRRILQKTGILSACTHSIALTKIESKDVEQGVLGRLFGFGDVIVQGSGGKVFRYENIAAPTTLSRAIGRAMAQLREQSGTEHGGTPPGDTTQSGSTGDAHPMPLQ